MRISNPTIESGVIEEVAPSEISLDALKEAEFKGIDPLPVRILELADELVRQRVRYRRYRTSRRLSREDLTVLKPRLSCSEFIWYLFSRAGLNMGDHPVISKRMAFKEGIYSDALVKITDGTIRPGDILAYANSPEELEAQKKKFGRGQVGHVVIVVSVDRRIVVGSHGRESTPPGGKMGAGYRRLLRGWEHWTNGRTLRATYRLSSAFDKKNER